MKLIGIDIGTTSVCGVVVTGDSGHVIDSCTLPNQSAISSAHAWERLQDPHVILDQVSRIVRTFMIRHGSLDAIGVTGQMHGVLYVDNEGDAVSPLYTWQDGRGQLPLSTSTYRDVLSQLSQHAVSTGFGTVTHFYLQHNRQIPQHAVTFCTIADFIAMKLGQQSSPVTDATNAAGIGLFDVSAGAFDVDAVQRSHMDPTFLPSVVPSASFVGQTVEGIPVYAGIGDNQASFLGSVRRPDASLLVNIGTGGQISFLHDTPDLVPGWELRPFPGGGFLLVGASLSGGKSYAMLEGFFRRVCELFTDHEPDWLYDRMNEILRTMSPLSDPLVVHTQFFGSRTAADCRGSILNISPDNWSPEHLMVAFLEGMAGELLAFYDHVPDPMKAHISAIVGSGNAIRNNLFLKRVIEARTGHSLLIPLNREEASVGAAICAGVGRGFLTGFQDGSKFVQYETDGDAP